MKKLQRHRNHGLMVFVRKLSAFQVLLAFLFSTITFASHATSNATEKIETETDGIFVATTVKGKITDETGAPLPGVNILIKGTTRGTTSDSDGNFNIEVDDSNAVLIFSFIGFKQQEVIVGNQTEIGVSLESDIQSLSEVVVVGYGTQKRASVTGAVDQIGSAPLEGKPIANVAQALQGVSPNLIIQQRSFQPVGASLNINIRGVGTTNNNDPLIVIDGIIGGDMNTLNPNDIESISVLKDAGAAAIYGSRSANGVLLITTKKGKKGAKPTITYSGMYGIQAPRITFDKVPAWEDATNRNISRANASQSPLYTQAQIDQFKAQGDSDWNLSSIIKNAPQQTHSLSLSGGGENNTYLMSFGYFDQDNVFVGPDYGTKRYNVRLNQSTTINKFTLTTIVSYSKTNNLEPTRSSEDLVVDMTRAPSFVNLQDDQGNYLKNNNVNVNPLAVLRNGGYRKSNNDEITGNFSGQYIISPSFKIRGVLGGNIRQDAQLLHQVPLYFVPVGANPDVNGNRTTTDTNRKRLALNTQLIAEYGKTFNKHDVNVLLAVSNESTKDEQSSIQKDLTDPTLGIPTTGTVLNPGNGDRGNGSQNSLQTLRETSLNSVFGRISYGYGDKYFIDGVFRYDGSSNFPSDKRWGFFPSIGGKWSVSEEGFLSGYKDKVGDLMLRASYGLVGAQNVDPYQYFSSYSTNPNVYGFNNAAVSGATRNLANPELTWEKSKKFNVGLDAAFFDRKLNFTFEYFKGVTSDILQNREDVPAFYGTGLPTYNTSEVENKGFDLKLTYDLKGKLFSHSFSANLGDSKNKLLNLTYNTNEYIFKREEFWFVRRVGLPTTTYMGYQSDGLYQTVEELASAPKFAGTTPGLGDLKYKDQDGNGILDVKDRVILGNPFPRFTFGFTYNVTFKGFDAQVFIQGVGKRDQLVRGELVEPYHFGYSSTMYEHQRDFWTPENTDAKWPRLAEAGSPSNNVNYRVGSDIFLFNSAYARLKNLQIGYSFPATITSKLHMQKLRIYVSGQNLITLSKMKFVDPEQSEFDNRLNISSGANSARAYPTPVFYGGGLNVTF